MRRVFLPQRLVHMTLSQRTSTFAKSCFNRFSVCNSVTYHKMNVRRYSITDNRCCVVLLSQAGIIDGSKCSNIGTFGVASGTTLGLVNPKVRVAALANISNRNEARNMRELLSKFNHYVTMKGGNLCDVDVHLKGGKPSYFDDDCNPSIGMRDSILCQLSLYDYNNVIDNSCKNYDTESMILSIDGNVRDFYNPHIYNTEFSELDKTITLLNTYDDKASVRIIHEPNGIKSGQIVNLLS